MTLVDDHFLDQRNTLHWNLDTKVSPGDHDAIRGLNDVVYIHNRLWLLDLGDDARM